MDKREEKTLAKVYAAFVYLIQEKGFDSIRIADILEEGHISRSTFYQHFKTKDDVLKSVVHHIFEHVFSAHLTKEKNHDFSHSSAFDYEHMITHIFYHFQEQKDLIKAILSSSASYLFLRELKENSEDLISALISSGKVVKKDIPLDMWKSQLLSGFVSILSYWIEDDCKQPPEEISAYFFKIYQ